MNQEIIAKANEIINASNGNKGGWEKGICTLALIDEDGYPTASTLSIGKSDGINWLTFVTGLASNKAKRIQKCNKASVCMNSAEYNITLVGTVEVLTDAEIKKDTWYSGCEYHFSGVDDPNYCVIRFTAKRYNLFIGDEEVAGTL